MILTMDKQLSGWKIFPALETICKRNQITIRELSKYLHKQIWSPNDRHALLESLSTVFLITKDEQFGHMFHPVLLDVATRCRSKIEGEEWSFTQHQDFCIAISHCLRWSDIQRLAQDYICGKPSFIPAKHEKVERKKKKAKKCSAHEESLCKAAWMFAHYLGNGADAFLPLKDILPYVSHDSQTVRWYACQTVMQLQLMSAASRSVYLEKHFTKTDCHRLSNRYSLKVTGEVSLDTLCEPEITNELTHTRHVILESDLCDRVTCVGGVVLSRLPHTVEKQVSDLLPVPSNQSNLHSLALAVAAGRPVLLQGVVGSGKTTLVEHLARQTGRTGPPHLLKIQLGDQMDSKALLGTYRCTEVPGEFIWQPGVLTQAVSQGYWVLLEDIDFAPMEVISILLPLLETRTLAVPGHGDSIKAAPGFHLFATRRLISSSSGWQQQQQNNTSVLLEKLWTSVLVEPLSRTELSQVLCSKYAQLETVVDKLLDIYFLLSAGHHLGTENDVAMETEDDNAGKFLSHDGRLISTRDLITWCGRIAQDFDASSSRTSNLVLQEALDCFVSCLSKPAKRQSLAESIGAYINITKVKVEYYCRSYKPDVTISPKAITVGRISLAMKDTKSTLQMRRRSTFSYTRLSSVLLEKIAVCVSRREPVLLVGETGTGKTSTVQFLADQLGHHLHVINMNQQSDSADLLGGFKPVDLRHIIKPFFEDFELQFCKSFSRKQNVKFIGHLQECFGKRKWDTLFSLMEHTTNSALKKFEEKKKVIKRWKNIAQRLSQLKLQVQQTQNTLAFTFMEGSLVKALRAGDWVLLDEINLAAMETLECLSGLLESDTGSLILMERGDVEPVVRHPDFRLFACMNPATDVGKKDLSPGIRNRFTELYVDELSDSQDLKVLVSDYLQGLSLSAAQVDGIVKFYLMIRNESVKKLTDGTGHPPTFSLRTLCRALRFAASNTCGSVPRSLYEGFCLSFLTQLDRSSHPVVEQLVCQHVVGKASVKSLLKQALPAPSKGRHLKFEGYWIPQGELEPETPENYILTPSVRANLKDLVRVVSAGQHPVLIQGETSVGKTSLIKWLAQSSGNVCVRVNNHEHTDLQEYVGCYAADENGKLLFKEGVLVEAMRRGQWIILDELNLAPTDVLEALNRLLDDNRELYIAETQEVVRAHPKFMLFATQNPPGHYGGRKMLSRAFRNRFVELHYDEIPSKELETILHERCHIPLSYARRLIAVMLELQTRRRGSGLFAGKMGYMTLRDLFRWAERYTCPEMDDQKFYDWDKHLAEQGYMLLAGRVRKPEEMDLIQEVIQKHFKCKICSSNLYTLGSKTSPTTKSILEQLVSQSAEGFHHVVWTENMRRMAVLIGQAIKYKEPVLLVGETGCGKTTVCQLYSVLHDTLLHSINCHLHTESADFLGGLRPVRSRTEDDKKDKLFEWVDGPLVQAMKEGAMFLIDEISLADDSVLERLNSVLEPERTVLLAEKGGGDGQNNEVEQVIAKDGFHVFATMNPGGDFGKKELSPALRNRFTEIWCPPSSSRKDLEEIIEHNMHSGIYLGKPEGTTSGMGAAIMDFVTWFSNNDIGKRCTISIRDILTWVKFINTCSKTDGTMDSEMGSSHSQLDPGVAYIHGACLVFLDGLGAGVTSQGQQGIVGQIRQTCLAYLLQQVNSVTKQQYKKADLGLLDSTNVQNVVIDTHEILSIPPFSIPKGPHLDVSQHQYALKAPGTCVNAQRLLRALQLPRPLLLEGSPGVGKTSLVAAIARAAGRDLVRINLSEQTDVTDLFGADLPVEGATGGVFAWRDGPLLQALKAGSWVVLDELNLASQSVLEGLNACLDHRGEVFIPELGKTFHIQQEQTQLFACQNPLNQGGGRKGLPKSFLNRFTQVFIEPLLKADLMFIATTMYPDLPEDILEKMISFNMQMHRETVEEGMWGQRGSPWEFNLRDMFRWCDLTLQDQCEPSQYNPGQYAGLIYADRMRSQADKHKVYDMYRSYFPEHMEAVPSTGMFHYDGNYLQVGRGLLKVTGDSCCHDNHSDSLEILQHSLGPLESVMKCVEMNWMAILVGPSGCGKSCVVDMLAKLSGNQLSILSMNSAMDTTELLGGFEQADFSRHIEDVAADIHTVFQQLCKHVILTEPDGCLETVAKLQKLWQDYQAHHVAGSGSQMSNVEELEIMRLQMAALSALNICCKKVAKQHKADLIATISSAKQRLSCLRTKLAEAVPGKLGGSFEWRDSLLVQSLKAGHWLLIDNVNFCSASVLDRLNALLEPNGVLSINERGVIDGSIPTITPHPNFRLFLAMDPRHGEISRAMRNRGVEIYIPGETEGNGLSLTDVHRIINSLGLRSGAVFHWLHNLHEKLKEELPRGDKPSLQNLIRVCRQVVEHCNHGYSIFKAVWMSCYTEYVQQQRHRDSRQLSLMTLTQSYEKWVTEGGHVTDGTDLGVSPVTLPGVNQYLNDPKSASVSRNVALFVDYLDQVDNSDTPGDIFSSHLKHSLNVSLALSPRSSLPYMVDWLSTYCMTVSHATRLDVCKYVVESLNEVYRNLLEAMVSCCQHDLLTDNTVDTSLDIRWNQQLLEKCIQMVPSSMCQENRAALELQFNRLHLAQLSQVELLLARRHVDVLQDALNKDKTRGRSSLHPAIPHLLNLYPVFSEVVMATIPNMDVSQYCMAAKILLRLGWFPHLLQEATVTLTHQQEAGSRLQIFWKWFQTNCLNYFTTPDKSCSQKLCAIADILDGILGSDDRRWKQFSKFLQSVGHPNPFKDETSARLNTQVQELLSVLYCHGNSLDMSEVAKVKVITQHRQSLVDLYRTVTSVVSQDDTEGIESAEKGLELLTNILTQNRLISQDALCEPMEQSHVTDTDQSDNSHPESSLPMHFVQLWPLFEYSSTLEGWKLLNEVTSESGTVSECFVDYIVQHSAMDAMTVELLNASAERKLPILMMLGCVLERLRKSPAVNTPDLWLQWTGSLPTEVENVKRSKKSFHQPTVTCSLYELLGRADTTVTIATPANTKINASLKCYQGELTQLSHISRHIWSHAAFYSSKTRQSNTLDKSSLITSWKNTLQSLSPLVEADTREEFDTLLGEPDLSVTDILPRLDQFVTKSSVMNQLTKFKQCIEHVRKVSVDTSGNLATLGVAWIHLGHLNVELLAPAGPVDPVEKVAIKLKLLTEELKETETELEVLSAHHRLVTGQELTSLSPRLVHPRVPHLLTRSRELTDQIEQLQEQTAYRPSPSQYPQLLSDVQNYLSSVGSFTTVQQLVQRCLKCLSGRAQNTSVLQEVELWEVSQEKFLAMLQKEYPLYRDIIQPFTAAVQQVIYGIHLLYCYMKQHLQLCRLVLDTRSHKKFSTALEQLILAVGRFPTISGQHPSCVALATTLTSDPANNLLKVALQGVQQDDDNQLSTVTNSILVGSLMHVQNEAKLRGSLSSELIMTLTHILETFVLSWQHQEQAKRDKEEQDASLYRFKDRIHGDERSEEEREEAEFRESFPEFPKEYQDLVEATSLDDDETAAAHTAASQEATVDVTDIQLTQISWVHQQLWKHLVHTDYYQPSAAVALQLSDWAQPLLSMYTAGSTLCSHSSDVLNSCIAPQLLGGHMIVSTVQQLYISQVNMQEANLLPEPEVYDIYHDSNAPEVIQCLPVLQNVLTRVGQLQQEWPDHPTLKQLCEIVERIKSFSITCSVMKILTGLELLLQKAQDWESNATQHVSMTTQLSEVSNLIVQYRKLELGCWMKALDTEILKYQGAASHWWFHLYQLIQSAIQSQPTPVAGDQGPVKPSIDEVTKALKQFMEQASLGDYQQRLNMLLSFHCQLVTMETNEDQHTQLVNILWNLYQFYSRFVNTVTGQLNKLRAPIERELKGFVKIARWSDINYWALKQTTEKTHRTLHKHLKSFQVVLQQSVQGILGDVDDGGDTTAGGDNSSWADRLKDYQTDLDKQLKQYKPPVIANLPELVSQEDVPLQYKLPQLCGRMNRHWRQMVHTSRYSQNIIIMDQFIGEVIDGVHELQALEIDRSETKEKQKSAAKHINLRRRKALSDLFKYLTQTGLSYRKGVTLAGAGTSNAITVPPLDLAAGSASTGSMKQLWDGCLHYYFTCVSRRAQFTEVILNPSKELGVTIIERCRGFTEHLYEILVHQYTAVAHIAHQHHNIAHVVNNMKGLVEERRSGFSQQTAHDWLVSCQDLVVQVMEGLHQFLVLLNCCPRLQEQTTLCHPSPLPVSQLHQMALVKHGDEKHTEAVAKVKELLSIVKTSQQMLPGKDKSLLLWSHILNMKTVLEKMTLITFDLEKVSSLFNDDDTESTNTFTDVLHFLTSEIHIKSHGFVDWFSSIRESSTDCIDSVKVSDWSSRLEEMVSEVLLVVQKLSKAQSAAAEDTTEKQVEKVPTDDDEEEEEGIPEGLIVKLLIEKLNQDRQIITSDKILNCLNNLVCDIADEPSQMTVSLLLQQLDRCLPLLTQYQDIVHHYSIGCLATQRTVGKLLSVLLKVFTDLATKGFCIPPELSDELSGEGATEFCDIEEGGLGEGEGTKNVSDQIENEDQLDEAKQPDGEKQDESQQPDVKSEENAIEMSEDFDAKVQDLEDADRQEDREEEEQGEEEEEVDKQMGDIGEEGEDKLDEQMWGSDEEPENEGEDEKEESGPGDGRQSEPELVAKDDNDDKTEGGGDKKEEEEEGEENEEKQKQNNLDNLDQDNYDDDQVDPYHGKDEQEKQAPEDMDLPDDLNLDGEEDKGQEEGEEEREQDGTGPEEESKIPDVPPDQVDEQTDEQTDEKEAEEEDSKESQEGEGGEDADENVQDKEDQEVGDDTKERQEEEGDQDPGFSPEDEVKMEEESNKPDTEADETQEGVEHYGTRSHDTEQAEQSDLAQDQAGEANENNQQETTGTGQASADQEDGHQGQKSTRAADTQREGKRKKHEREPGKSETDRTLGSTDQKYKRLKTADNTDSNQPQDEGDQQQQQADMYEHVQDSDSHHDAQTLDVATAEQQEQQQLRAGNEDVEEEDEEDVGMDVEEENTEQDSNDVTEMKPSQIKNKSAKDKDANLPMETEEEAEAEEQKYEIPGDKVATATVARGPESTIHTALEHLNLGSETLDLETLRQELESQLGQLSETTQTSSQDPAHASDLWHRYEALTSGLAQDLCEQLRLVLEPTQATKLKGDYRTGKRLNMRKVIAYIASDFRKDKIWLRRTKPCKRQYQVMLAIDDSASMVDNHSKQMAFESLSLISNALTLLEAGQLSICSFGESVNVLHPFTEQFTSQSGAHLLQYLTFEQKKTKIAHLVYQATLMMMEARQQQQGTLGNPETSQLLLIVSDGRGLFMEGMEVVKNAVRQARQANVFLVFIIIDNPVNKDSILDIKVPVFKQAGQVPEIHSYMDSFPFPFYVILRDINTLPMVLSDALRQWFELVTALDR